MHIVSILQTAAYTFSFILALGSTQANAGSGSYAPGVVECPSTPLVRVAEGLSSDEANYVNVRKQKHAHRHQVEFFNRINIPGFDPKSIFGPDKAGKASKHRTALSLGMAVSGGGVRAMLTGAGALSALDKRTLGSQDEGHVGGLLQSMSYLSGLSGGAWLLGSVMMSNMPTISSIITTGKMWDFTINPLLGEVADKDLQEMFESNVLVSLEEYLVNHNKNTALQNELKGNVKPIVNLFANFTPPPGIRSVYQPYAAGSPTVEAQGFRKAFVHNVMPGERISKHYETLYEEILPKRLAGFSVSVTDFWARALRKVFLSKLPRTEMAWSDVTTTPVFANFEAPYPILVANALVPKTIPDASTSTIVEMTPYEVGSWGPTLGAFARTRYLGTKLENGNIKGNCIQGFDNGAFIVATSSSLFNDLAAMGMKHLDTYPQLRNVLTKYTAIKTLFSTETDVRPNTEYSLFSPSPFFGFHQGVSIPSPAEMQKGTVTLDGLVNIKKTGNSYTNSKTLHLVDGGEDDLNIPLDPLLHPARKLDMIIALDVSLDKEGHTNGSAFYRHTWRYHGKEHVYNISFPHVPEPNVFLARQLYTGTKFFGCDLDAYPNAAMFNGSSPSSSLLPKPPLIVYMPNHDISFSAQQPTTRLIYKPQDVAGMIQNGYDMLTQRNSTRWTQCLGCAAIHRAVVRRGVEWPEFCKGCFEEYCVS